MRASIIIHSITGNLFIISQVFKEKLTENGIDARIYRVEDSDLHLVANQSNEANEFYEDIISLPVASNEKLLKGDIIIIGTPSVFGSPSSEMEAFLSKTEPLLKNKELKGKFFYGFSTTKHGLDDGTKAILSLENWANEMEMKILKTSSPFVHDDGEEVVMRPGTKVEAVADELTKAIFALA